MNVLEFFKNRERICDSFRDCDEGCPLHNCGKSLCDKYVISDIKERVGHEIAIVEKWAKEHPVKTRQSELLKLFPDTELNDAGIICLCPKDFGYKPNRDKFGACLEKCKDCQCKFWLAEIEEEKHE